jgi:hypothetical protein
MQTVTTARDLRQGAAPASAPSTLGQQWEFVEFVAIEPLGDLPVSGGPGIAEVATLTAKYKAPMRA